MAEYDVSCGFVVYGLYYCVLVTESCLTLCDPMDCSLPGSSVRGISQARILEWVAMPFPWDLPHSGIEPISPALADGFFTTEPLGNPVALIMLR